MLYSLLRFFAFKTAKDNGRNGPLWALAALGIGFGFQIVIPVLVGVILALIYMAMGTSVDQLEEQITTPATILGFACLFLSFIGIWLVLRHVAKLPEDEPVNILPPPPTFGQSD